MIKELLIVGTGSCLGGMARYGASLALRSLCHGFPWATLTVNILGCLLIGILSGAMGRCPNQSLQTNLFFAVGFCGGFTTFSTFSKESLSLLQAGNYTAFALYAVGSVMLGIAAVAIGFAIAK